MIQNAVKTVTGEPMATGEMIQMIAGTLIGIGADMAISALLGAHMPKEFRRVLFRSVCDLHENW